MLSEITDFDLFNTRCVVYISIIIETNKCSIVSVLYGISPIRNIN